MKIAKSIGLKSVEGTQKNYIDLITGLEVATPVYVNMHNRVENVYWNLHIGIWMGQTGKFFILLGGSISTTLSITGLLIWWGCKKN